MGSISLAQWATIISSAFVLVCIVQIFYYLFFFARLIKYQPPDTGKSEEPVSIIICARDEERNILQNLPYILQQSPEIIHEVLIVNDNSLDTSKFTLQEFERNHPQLKVLELTQESKGVTGKKVPLSIGIKSAKNDIVLLTDADCKPASEHWLKSMLHSYADDTEIVLGYGAFRKKRGLLNKLIRWETAHAAIQYMSYALARIPYMGVGRNLSYKKNVFFRHKGFASHIHLPGGDDDLFINQAATRRNTSINLDKNAFTISTPVSSWKNWRHQKNRHYTSSRMYKPLHKFLLGLYALSQFLVYPLFILALFENWQIAICAMLVKTLLMHFIFSKCLEALDEKDLIPWVWLLDLWMFFYYLVFASAVFRRPAKQWK